MVTETRRADVLEMPSLYFERTTPEEQARHAEKLRDFPPGGALRIDPVQGAEGGWHAEIIGMDWEEPGLLDRIFEAILNCIHVPGGIAFRRIRIFTGRTGQVVNLLELQDKQGRPLTREKCGMVLAELRKIRQGERVVLETIMNLTFTTHIPLINQVPYLDNSRSEHYTYLELEMPRLSNRFTSILLHFLARSEFRVNVQVAEMVQDRRARYALYVVDKQGGKLRDSHFTRISLVRMLERMNQLILRFNQHYIKKAWNLRVERNHATMYLSRPDPQDFLDDLGNIRQIARLQGFADRLSALVEGGLLDSKDYYFLKRMEAFCEENRPRFLALSDAVPSEEDVALCRDYFEDRRRSLRIMGPLFQRLMELEPVRPRLSDTHRLHALSRPFPHEGFALDRELRLYLTGSMWMAEPSMALDPFLLLARTGCFLRNDTVEATEAALTGWTPRYIAEHRESLGRRFQLILDESLRQGTTAVVLRNLRQVGLLQRFLPGWERITGLIHVVSDHTYTVDEHSILAAEALNGMRLLRQVLPDTGPSPMRRDYQRLETAVGLANYARKYAVEERMLRMIPQLRSDPSIKPFFNVMAEVRANTLEYILEVNLLEHSYSTCMNALHQIEAIRGQLSTLLDCFGGLPFEEQRNLVLAALLHDMLKPDPDHGRAFAPEVPRTLAATGMILAQRSVERIGWLVRHHLDLSGLMSRLGSEGEAALDAYLAQEGPPSLLRSLVVFTYADRVAVHQDPNKNAHNAMTLSGLLDELARWERAHPGHRDPLSAAGA